MRSNKWLWIVIGAVVISAGALTAALTIPIVPASPAVALTDEEGEADADIPPRRRGRIDKETYMRLRDEYISSLRGIEPGAPLDPSLRTAAIRQMETQLSSRMNLRDGAPIPWTP